MSVKRYELAVIGCHRGFDIHGLKASDAGSWVSYDDHAAAVARLREAGDALETRLKSLRSAAIYHGGILLGNEVAKEIAAWREAVKESE